MPQLKKWIENENYKKTFLVKKRDGVSILKIDNICYFQAQGDFVLAIDFNDRKHILNESLTQIEHLLNPSNFFRINRSEIISRISILKYNQYIKNRLALTLTDLKITLYTSNSRTPEFRNWIEN
ncbi:MAG: LytTR family DNA-binding domain-containing protein [Cellulophaga sp.]